MSSGYIASCLGANSLCHSLIHNHAFVCLFHQKTGGYIWNTVNNLCILGFVILRDRITVVFGSNNINYMYMYSMHYTLFNFT